MYHPKPIVALLTVLAVLAARPAWAQGPADQKAKPFYPVAVLPFAERGVGIKDQGQTAADVLLAGLAAGDNLILVERQQLDKILEEAALNRSGVVNTDEATQIGRLTGAKVLVTGSVFRAGNKNYVVAKIIGTETSRLVGRSVSGTEEVAELAEKLSALVIEAITKSAAELVAAKVERADRAAALKKQVGERKLPVLLVEITETHLGRPAVDPAAQTEMTWYCKELGATVIDAKEGNRNEAEYRIVGEGFSEFGGQLKDLINVKARLEVKVLDRAGKVVATDRQTTVMVDLTELAAGKAALQEASAQLAERLLPKLAK